MRIIHHNYPGLNVTSVFGWLLTWQETLERVQVRIYNNIEMRKEKNPPIWDARTSKCLQFSLDE